jgi:hypothetical protein
MASVSEKEPGESTNVNANEDGGANVQVGGAADDVIESRTPTARPYLRI